MWEGEVDRSPPHSLFTGLEEEDTDGCKEEGCQKEEEVSPPLRARAGRQPAVRGLKSDRPPRPEGVRSLTPLLIYAGGHSARRFSRARSAPPHALRAPPLPLARE